MGETRLVALPRDLKIKNCSEMLRVMGIKKSFTIMDISEELNISRQTVTKAVNEFIGKGLLVESGLENSGVAGGRKPKTFSLNPEKYIMTVMLYAKMCRFALVNLTGEVVAEEPDDSGLENYETFLNILSDTIPKLMEKNNVDPESFLGAVIGTGGIIDEESGKVYGCALWPEEVDLRGDLQRRFDFPINVCVGNVARICAGGITLYSEYTHKRTAVLYLDHGVGFTLIEDGTIRKTKHNLTGELGHMILKLGSDTFCDLGDQGCFESLISERYLLGLAGQLSPVEKAELMHEFNWGSDFRLHILREAEKGSTSAQLLETYLAEVIGVALQNIELCHDPDVIVLQGSFSHWTTGFKKRVLEVCRRCKYLKNIEISIVEQDCGTDLMLDKGSIAIMLKNIFENE